MRRLGIHIPVACFFVSALVGAVPGHASTTTVTRVAPFDFGCRAQTYEDSGPSGRCLQSADAPRQGQLTARHFLYPRVTYSPLMPVFVGSAYVGDSAGIRIEAAGPSRVFATVVARGHRSTGPSPISHPRLCASLRKHDGAWAGGVCQPLTITQPTTLRTTFDGVTLSSVESPYRFIVWLAGSGRATVRSITYRVDATPTSG